MRRMERVKITVKNIFDPVDQDDFIELFFTYLSNNKQIMYPCFPALLMNVWQKLQTQGTTPGSRFKGPH